jgi:hypothetical protein
MAFLDNEGLKHLWGKILNLVESKSGGADIDVTAEVGHTIVVKEVDNNGKPTKWEAVEHQPRTHWRGPVEVLPVITCEVIEDIGAATLPDMSIAAGDNLTVVYNGAEYKCTCTDLGDGILVFGNYGVMDEENPVDTGEPFAAVKTDNGNGTLIWACIPLDGLATFTLSIIGVGYHTIPYEYLPNTSIYYVDVMCNLVDDGSLNIISSAPTDFETIYSVLEKDRIVIVRAIVSNAMVLYYNLVRSYRNCLTFYSYGGILYQAPNILITLEEDGTTIYEIATD